MFALFCLLVELALLAFTSHSIQTRFSQFLYRNIRSQRLAVLIYAFLFFPGTFVHEIAHLFGCLLCLVRTGEINLLPKIEEDHIILGHVAIAQTDRIRRTFIGIAPLLVGIATLVGGISYLGSHWQNFGWPSFVVAAYLVFTITNSMFPSPQDLEGSLAFGMTILVIIIVVFGTWYYFSSQSLFSLVSLAIQSLNSLSSPLWSLAGFLLIPVGFNLLCIGLVHRHA